MSSMVTFKKKKCQSDNNVLAEILFKTWLDEICENRVKYASEGSDYITAEFEQEEDAIMLCLAGLPDEIENYITLR